MGNITYTINAWTEAVWKSTVLFLPINMNIYVTKIRRKKKVNCLLGSLVFDIAKTSNKKRNGSLNIRRALGITIKRKKVR
jgi:hypothetical protein